MELKGGRVLSRSGEEMTRCVEGTAWTGLVGTELSEKWRFEGGAERQTVAQRLGSQRRSVSL